MDAVRTLEALEPLDVGASRERPPVDTSIFLGSWTSTNRDTQGLARLLVRREGGDLVVRAFGACALSLYDWGEVRATVFADGPDSTQGHAFIAQVRPRLQGDVAPGQGEEGRPRGRELQSLQGRQRARPLLLARVLLPVARARARPGRSTTTVNLRGAPAAPGPRRH